MNHNPLNNFKLAWIVCASINVNAAVTLQTDSAVVGTFTGVAVLFSLVALVWDE